MKRKYVLFNTPLLTATAAKSLQSCPTLCDTIDISPSGSPVPGILQARILEWVAISFSNAWKWKVKVKSLSCVWPSAIPWTAAFQAPPSMGFSRQEYWIGVPLPSPSLLTTSSQRFSPMFITVDFIILYFTFRSMNLLKVNFCVSCEIRVELIFFSYTCPVVLAPFTVRTTIFRIK